MAILQILAGQTSTYGDVLDILDGKLYLSSCGFAPFSLCHADHKVRIRDIGHAGFTGPLVSMPLKEGKITMARLVETIGGYELHMTRADAIKSDLRQGRFPAVFAKIDGDLEEFKNRLMANHYAFVYSDIRVELLELAKLLNWEVVDYESL
jgi:L-fucose isomerase-like protein